MLKVQELKEIMGFPKDYVFDWPRSRTKNTLEMHVEVTMARKICEAAAM